MIESYQTEVMRKRRAARFFWLVVFICAIFLYFFFQGYYPDVRLGMRRIFSESGSKSDMDASDLIKSFGIINVKTTPADATMTLGSGTYYGNNEKKMSDYGNYTMRIEKTGYVTNTMNFIIDREKPFFIEKLSLLPLPRYHTLTGVKDIYQVASEEYIMRTASGLIWSGATASGKVNSTGSLEHIGGKYFQTNTGVLRWETNKFERASVDISNFIRTCPKIEWRYEIFSCPNTQSLLTQAGKYMTGILHIENHLLERSGTIMEISDMTIGKAWSYTGAIDLTKVILMNSEFYTNNSGTLIPRDTTEEKILTPLDTIIYASMLREDTIFIGSKEGKPHLLIRHTGDPVDRDRDIRLPENISYKNIELYSLDGNILIKTPQSILFVYQGSHEIVSIVEGDIFSYSDTGLAYRKDGKIWWVDWSNP